MLSARRAALAVWIGFLLGTGSPAVFAQDPDDIPLFTCLTDGTDYVETCNEDVMRTTDAYVESIGNIYKDIANGRVSPPVQIQCSPGCRDVFLDVLRDDPSCLLNLRSASPGSRQTISQLITACNIDFDTVVNDNDIDNSPSDAPTSAAPSRDAPAVTPDRTPAPERNMPSPTPDQMPAPRPATPAPTAFPTPAPRPATPAPTAFPTPAPTSADDTAAAKTIAPSSPSANRSELSPAAALCNESLLCLGETQLTSFSDDCLALLPDRASSPPFNCTSDCSSVFDLVSQDCINLLASDAGGCFPEDFQRIFRACGRAYSCVGSCPTLPPLSSPPPPPPAPSSTVHCKVLSGIVYIGVLVLAATLIL